MELYEQILARALAGEEIRVVYVKTNEAEIVEKESYRALKRIRDILANGALSDDECYLRIEELVGLFEEWEEQRLRHK
ncbi:MAG: hypothetical protein IJB67_00590 [Firmicutes bacterium]|nr:hypothetical protein [Bacillota bacterium]